MNKEPIIFLDLDNIITISPNYKDFNPDCVNNLKFVLKETGAKIVVHSTWRNFEGHRNKFLYLWGKWGFDFEDFYAFAPTGKKVVKDNISGGDDIEYYASKKDVIEKWLKDHEQIVENFVIIDDEDYNFPPDKFVQPKNGLSFDDAKLAIEILNR